jgi:cysteinyl-tRNA synthetase
VITEQLFTPLETKTAFRYTDRMSLTLYNTLGRGLQEFKPLNGNKVGFYGCGPTVYNYAHIGNLRAYVLHDILTRTLRERGYEVTHVMNITDVGHLSGDDDSGEDKMVKSAEEQRKSVLEVADFYAKAFFRDTGLLNIERPTVVCKATDHIDCMLDLIKRIEANGYTYQAGGNLYFDTAKFSNYGELALLKKTDGTHTIARTDEDKNKRSRRDFVLWFTKSKFANQALVWDSPWGRGYPGWHIECSAMSIKYLGEQFDIHAGGIDHIPIHHTNEIAQSEAATGKRPWVKYWLHNEFLVVNRSKMSKSAGSFLTLQKLLDSGFDALDYRYFLLGGHYRSQLQFSWEALKGARAARLGIVERLAHLKEQIKGKEEDSTHPLSALNAFNAALDDDLNTPRALGELWKLVKDDSVPPAAALAAAYTMDKVLGLKLRESVDKAEKAEALVELDTGLAAAVEAAIAKRAACKKAKDFAGADKIRDDLKAQGIALTDTKDGTTWKKVL